MRLIHVGLDEFLEYRDAIKFVGGLVLRSKIALYDVRPGGATGFLLVVECR